MILRTMSKKTKCLWKSSLPPKDGSPFVVLAQVSYHDDRGGYVNPVCDVIYFDKSADDWCYLDTGLVVCNYCEELRIWHWTELPEPSSQCEFDFK